MTECFACGRDMTDAAGCDADRTIEFADGETLAPVPFGEHTQSCAEVVADLEQDIADGGRGTLTVSDTKDMLEDFKDRWTPEEYNSRDCHDCGAAIGEYHHPGCDMEPCPRCGEQYAFCDCVTGEKQELWEGHDAA